MADAFYGEVRAFAFNYPPVDWAFCNGAVVAVSQYQALYSVIGNSFGGVEAVSFALPNMQGMVPLGAGDPSKVVVSSGMPSSIPVGTVSGAPSVTLDFGQMPMHTHKASAQLLVRTAMDAEPATDNSPSRLVGPPQTELPTGVPYPAWASAPTADTTMNPFSISITCGNAKLFADPHENRQPFLVLNFCICLVSDYYPYRG